MGDHRAPHASPRQAGTATRLDLPRGHQRRLLRPARRDPLAADAHRPAALANGLRWFAAWRDSGLFETINHALVTADRERVGREASPSAAILDSQSVRTTESGGPRGYDAGKKVTGRKRHALVDTDGRMLLVFAHPADIQDRDGAGPLLKASRRFRPFVRPAFADSAYDAARVATATSLAVEIVRKHPDQVGFAVHRRRGVVERFVAWINRNRRLAKDVEATIPSAVPFLYAASVMLLTRRLARAS